MQGRLGPEEKAQLERDGFLLRAEVYPADELGALRAAAERVAERVGRHAERVGAGPARRLADGHRLQFSSQTAIQWEWAEGSREIRLLEPVDHLAPEFDALFEDARLVEPMRDLLGHDALAPFTSKLNLKRGSEGSEFPWHQDYPYWYARVGEQAREIATAILFLDDADAANGALRVLPESHRSGPAPRDPNDPTRALADPARLPVERERMLAAPAGSVLFFGSLLVHRSSPNRSGRDRRALLLSFQPAGRPHAREAPYHPEWLERLP